jgi:hypothetical protein
MNEHERRAVKTLPHISLRWWAFRHPRITLRPSHGFVTTSMSRIDGRGIQYRSSNTTHSPLALVSFPDSITLAPLMLPVTGGTGRGAADPNASPRLNCTVHVFPIFPSKPPVPPLPPSHPPIQSTHTINTNIEAFMGSPEKDVRPF